MGKEKRPGSEPSITTATGGAASDSTDHVDKQRCSTDTGGDAGGSTSADPALRAIAADIEKFEKNPKVQEIGEGMEKNSTNVPFSCYKTCLDMLKEVHPNRVDVADLRGILKHYGLPQYFKVLEEDWQSSLDKDKDASRSDNEELYAGDLPPASWSADEELYGSDFPPSAVRDLMWDDRDLLSSDEE